MNPIENRMDVTDNVTTAMEIVNQPNVTLQQGNIIQPRNTDTLSLSKEERDFYQLIFGNDIAAVRFRRLHCTACDVHIGSAPGNSGNMYAHPVLLTLLCSDCRKFYGDGNFEQGEDATDMFCRWCANGGNLYCCSYCSNTFCNKCIKRNFDPVVRKKIEDEERWKCFVCDPTDLYTARAVCWALLQHVQTVTRILKNDRMISKENLKVRMCRDESKCCGKKRKAKRRKLSANGSDEDESYQPSIEEPSSPLAQKILKRSPRLSSLSNGEQNKSLANITPKQEIDSSNIEDEEEDLPPPMIPCVQSMVEGDSNEVLTETLIAQSDSTQISTSTDKVVHLAPPTLQINPIPTANLLKVTTPPPLTPIKTISGKRTRIRSFQHILPAPNPNYSMVNNPSPQNCPSQTLHGMEYAPVPLCSPGLQPNVPMVAIPKPATSSPSRVHTIEYSSLPLRAPSVTSSTFNQISKTLAQKMKPTSSSTKEAEVIEIRIDSDSDEHQGGASTDKDKGGSSTSKSRDMLRHMSSKATSDSTKFPNTYAKRRIEKPSNTVEEEIDLRTEEVRMLFKMIGTKLRRVPLLHLPNHNNLRSTRVKTRRFHLALTKAISVLSDINDKVVHKYSNWRKSMLEESTQTCSGNASTANESIEDVNIPLDMTCTNSESDSDNNDDYDSDNMYITEKVKNVKSFQERDTVDIGVGETVSTADKSVQAFDVVERDYEKCIGHSVLTKVEYDPIDGSEILKPVIVPAEYNGKFEEQFIFYLQHREEREVKTDDDIGLPDPNETPLKDLIESNSPFVLEMLESIDSPLPNGMITSELVTEASDESGKENEDRSEPTNVVKELAKMVTELSEDLKTSRSNETVSEKHSEHVKKDRRKQIFENIGSEEVNMAVQTLIEEDERSRSSSNDDEIVTRHEKLLPSSKKGETGKYVEDECTIID